MKLHLLMMSMGVIIVLVIRASLCISLFTTLAQSVFKMFQVLIESVEIQIASRVMKLEKLIHQKEMKTNNCGLHMLEVECFAGKKILSSP